jgi:regulatory protein
MKIMSIKQQLNRADRFSIFIDGEYSFSLGENALLKSKLVVGQEISEVQLEKLKQLSANDVLYEQAQRYAAGRLHSRWEMAGYLQRKDASPALIDAILNKLSDIGLLDGKKFAEAFVADRQRLRPTSRRKIIFELRAKHVPEDIVKAVLGNEADEEHSALRTLVDRKRQQARYQDDTKLMQYLVRQGFGYGDVKAALKESAEDEA